MIDPPAQIVRDFLIAQALVSLPALLQAWPIFVQHLTDVQRDDACAIYDTDPLLDGRIVRSGEVILHPGLQFKTRSVEYETGWLKDDTIQRALCAAHNENVIIESRTWRIDNITKLSAAFIGTDEQRRNIFSSNYMVTIRSI